MQYAILRHAKIKAPLMGAAIAHNHRTSSVEKCNIDASHTPLNQVLKGEGTVAERLAGKLKGLTTKVRKDAVVAVELVLSASPEWFDGLTKNRKELHGHPKFREWVKATMAWARGEFGKNILDVSLHMDESSPHMHVLAVPLTKDGRLCAKEVLAKSELIRRQDGYAKAMEGFGLSRGDSAKETKRRHIKLTEEPGAGGKASALAAELAKAQAELAKMHKRVSHLLQVSMADAKRITELEAKVVEAEKRASLNHPTLEAKNQAVEAFLSEHEGLARAKPGEVKVGRLVASAGQFAVLHVGRGRHVLHEFPSEQAIKELERGQVQSLGR